MKIFSLTFALILLIMTFLIGLKKYRNFIISKELKNEEKNKLKKSAEILNECFDLKNKSKRTQKDSMKLIKYCLEEFGSEK